MFKEIYSFTVEDVREVEEKTKEKRKNDKGVEEEVEVTKKVEKKVPFTIGIKEPTRRELEEADMEFSIEMSNCIKKGILTKAMLAKKYSDTGGLLAESDANKLVDLYAELADCEAEYTQRTLQNKNVKRLPKAVREEIDKLSARIAIARRDIVTLESSYQSLFNHTADTKAQNRIVMWYVTHLSHFKKSDDEDTYKPLFEGESFEAKIDSYYNKDEISDSLFELTSGKLAALISYWYFSNDPKKEDFDKIINDIDGPK
tara:strand:+ start:3340 stop:4113 length:774 start_codon:yes stop_codon:yes gene_type:complete